MVKLVGVLSFLAIAASGVVSQSLQPGAPCSPEGATFCAASFSNIILTCTNGQLSPGNCNDNLAGVPPVGVKTAAICGNSSATNAACYLPPYPSFITSPSNSTTTSSSSPTSTPGSSIIIVTSTTTSVTSIPTTVSSPANNYSASLYTSTTTLPVIVVTTSSKTGSSATTSTGPASFTSGAGREILSGVLGAGFVLTTSLLLYFGN